MASVCLSPTTFGTVTEVGAVSVVEFVEPVELVEGDVVGVVLFNRVLTSWLTAALSCFLLPTASILTSLNPSAFSCLRIAPTPPPEAPSQKNCMTRRSQQGLGRVSIRSPLARRRRRR